MIREVIVRRLAEGQLAEASAWYEARSPGLGVDFLNRFEAMLPQLASFPESCPAVFLDYRRALLQRFPFGIFDVVEGDVVVVAGVYHLARDPREIRSEL